jgi:signal transduction histidine kinase
VELDLTPSAAHLLIGDDGLGFDGGLDPGHMGLRTMRERADEIGAELSVATRTGEGTAVTLVWTQDMPGATPSLDLSRRAALPPADWI